MHELMVDEERQLFLKAMRTVSSRSKGGGAADTRQLSSQSSVGAGDSGAAAAAAVASVSGLPSTARLASAHNAAVYTRSVSTLLEKFSGPLMGIMELELWASEQRCEALEAEKRRLLADAAKPSAAAAAGPLDLVEDYVK